MKVREMDSEIEVGVVVCSHKGVFPQSKSTTVCIVISGSLTVCLLWFQNLGDDLTPSVMPVPGQLVDKCNEISLCG